MRVTITTEGGFTGRGIGSASGEIADAELASLRSGTWREDYAAPAGGADLVRYTLTLQSEGVERRVSWQEGAAIPRELEELARNVWRRGISASPPERR